MEIAVIILAAGGSRRLGQPKQLLHLSGQSLLRRAAQAAIDSHADHCVVVLGNEAERCGREVSNLPVSLEFNPAWEEGMGSSIRAGVLAARRHYPMLDAVILAPCDQPFLNASLLDELIDLHLGTACGIVASCYDDTPGIPVLFCAAYFDRLASLEGDRGARILFDPGGKDVAHVRFDDGRIDIDTPEDVAAFAARMV